MDETSIEKLIFMRVIGLLQEVGPVVMSHLQTVGVLGELLVYQYLLKTKNDSHIQYPAPNSSYDILSGDERIEVKTALQNENGNYCVIIRSNNMSRWGQPFFDKLIAVLLESPMAKPVFIEIDQESILNHTGFNSDIAGFKKRFKLLN